MKKLILFILFIVGCSTEPEDCAGVEGGTAVVDECDICDGIDGYVAGSCYDCADTPNGDAVVDNCGVCDNITTNDCTADCDGVYGGTAIEDIDGNCYATVLIGDQLWMAENLKTTHYNNGIEINTGIDYFNFWNDVKIGAYIIYPSDSSRTCNGNCADIYGNLYNWYAVNDEKGICPNGFTIPSDDDWTILTDFLAPDGTANETSWYNNIAGGMMKSTGTLENFDGLWYSPNESANNESGFNALPAGWRGYYAGREWGDLGKRAQFISSSEYQDIFVGVRELFYDKSHVHRTSYYKLGGYSVRCLKE